MHRFYMVQSFTRFHRNVSHIPPKICRWAWCSGLELTFVCLHQVISPAALFLAAKVEEQPRKLEHVIKVAHACLNPQEPSPDIRSDVSTFQSFLYFGCVWGVFLSHSLNDCLPNIRCSYFSTHISSKPESGWCSRRMIASCLGNMCSVVPGTFPEMFKGIVCLQS